MPTPPGVTNLTTIAEHGPISVSRLATCLLLSFEIPVRSIQAGRVMPSMLLCKLSTYNRRSIQQRRLRDRPVLGAFAAILAAIEGWRW
jgi:hypothetical protein